jgi:transcriptional regulator with XRE-family HTH domain
VAKPKPDPLGDFIRVQRRFADLSLRQLAELANVSNAYLSQVERGLYKPSAHVLRSIAGALDLSAETLYERAGLLDEDDVRERRTGVEEAIALDEALTDEQKESLVRLYRVLRSDPAS